MMKRILSAIVMSIILAIPVAALNLPDLNRSGAIDVTVCYDGKAVSGGELTLYRVGDIVQEDGNYSFVLTDRFSSSGITLENLQQPETAKKFSAYAAQQGITGKTKKIDTNGKLIFDELNPGLYLLVQNKAATGYQKLNPFLVSLPMREADGYSYHVDAGPKVSPVPTPPTNTEQPQTGQSGWPIWTFLFSTAALAVVLYSRKRV